MPLFVLPPSSRLATLLPPQSIPVHSLCFPSQIDWTANRPAWIIHTLPGDKPISVQAKSRKKRSDRHASDETEDDVGVYSSNKERVDGGSNKRRRRTRDAVATGRSVNFTVEIIGRAATPFNFIIRSNDAEDATEKENKRLRVGYGFISMLRRKRKRLSVIFLTLFFIFPLSFTATLLFSLSLSPLSFFLLR